MDFAKFIYEQKENQQVISLLLNNGVVVSGRFSAPKRSSITVGASKYLGAVHLKSVTIIREDGEVAKLAELIVPEDTVTAWAVGKFTPIQMKDRQSNA